MKKTYFFIIFILFIAMSFTTKAMGIDSSLSCEFTMTTSACVEQHVNIVYTGGAPENATYNWDFDSAVILSGSGQGPYWVKWLTTGIKNVTLTIHWETANCTKTKEIHIVGLPDLFHMTGGGSYPAGGDGVNVGLSGSQTETIYKLFRNGDYTGIYLIGTGAPLDFGKQTVAGTYTCKARLDGTECWREMEGTAVVIVTGEVPFQHICMVTFDTAVQKNKIIWNKADGVHLSHFNIYKEIYQNNIFEKIGEVPYTNFSTFVDESSDPLVKSDKYKISIVDSAGHESEKSPFHKTIHLNINPGIYGFNLIWNHYEGFEFKTYKIHRKFGNESWTLIDSVASNVDSYTDYYTTPGLSTYYIEVVRLEPCHPTIKSTEYLSVVSNTATAAPLGIEEDKLTGIMIYPNPVSERLVVSIPGDNEIFFHLEVFCPDGRKVMDENIKSHRTEYEVSDFPKGLYILKIEAENSLFVRKFFKH